MMKQHIRALVIVLSFFAGSLLGKAAAAVAEGAPIPQNGSGAVPTKLNVTPLELDMPEVPVWESVTTSIAVENPTDKAITIKNLHPNCGCLDVKMPVTLIAPGKSEAISAKYVGQFGIPSKTVMILFNTDEDNAAETKIKLHLKTKQEFTVAPTIVQFGRVNKGESKALDVVIKSVDGKPFTVQQVRGPSKEFVCSFAAVDGSDGAVWKATVTVTGIKGGHLSQTATFVTDRPARGIVPVNLAAEVASDVVCAPDSVTALAGADNVVAPFEVIVRRTTPGKLEIQRVTESRQLALEYAVKQTDDSSAQVTIRLKEPFAQRAPLGQFVIQTNAEENALHLPYRISRGQPAGEQKPAANAH